MLHNFLSEQKTLLFLLEYKVLLDLQQARLEFHQHTGNGGRNL